MSQHKIVKIPDWVLPNTEEYLNEIGKDGWELVHLYNQHAYLKSSAAGTLISGSLDASLDAFGRQRVSEVFTLGDYKHLYAINENFVDFTTASATISHDANASLVTLSTGAVTQSRAVHQTKMFHNYMPGKSQLILSSFVFGSTQPGVIKRTGYYDDYNGIFLEQDATGSLQFVIRSATSGTASLTEERVKQENWNVNTLLSGSFTLDMTHTQLFYIDFQWLAVGRVRCGFVHKGSTVICHVFDHTNELAVPYMSNPNLPIRCEIQNTTTEVGSMKQICATVGSEGGYIEAGTAWELSSPTLRAVSSGSTLPVMAIRLKNSYNNLQNRAFVRIGQISAFTEDQTVRYNLVKIPNSASLSGGSWVSMDPDSVVEYNVGATSYTTGSSFLGGFIFAGGTGAGNNIAGQQQTPAPNARGNFIAQNFQSNDSEIYALVIKNMTGTSTDVGCSITWQEIY